MCGIEVPEAVVTDDQCVTLLGPGGLVLDDSLCDDAWVSGVCSTYCLGDLSVIPMACRDRGEPLVRAALGNESASRVAKVLAACASSAAPAPAPSAA